MHVVKACLDEACISGVSTQGNIGSKLGHTVTTTNVGLKVNGPVHLTTEYSTMVGCTVTLLPKPLTADNSDGTAKSRRPLVINARTAEAAIIVVRTLPVITDSVRPARKGRTLCDVVNRYTYIPRNIS